MDSRRIETCSSCRLVTFLCVIVLSLQQDTPVTPLVPGAVTPTAPEAVSPGEAGNTEPKKLDKLRIPVQHSSLVVNQVMNSNSKNGFALRDAAGKESIHKQTFKYSGPPISAHNRPRKNYILPGRRLWSLRSCRPYEVISEDGKCVHKKGKIGLYKHRNHVYGPQRKRKHRKSGHKVKENTSTNKTEREN